MPFFYPDPFGDAAAGCWRHLGGPGRGVAWR